MPGIAGIYNSEGPASELELATMVAAFDYDSRFLHPIEIHDSKIGLRCSTIAHKFASSSSYNRHYPEFGLSLAFSGEIVVSGKSPGETTNTVVDSYLADANSFPISLNGTFSGLLIDHRKSTAVLFNDRFGMERLYTHQRGSCIYFASEAKCILRLFPNTRCFDADSLRAFLTFGCVTGSQTLFQNIRLFEPATRLEFSISQQVRKSRYFSPSLWAPRTQQNGPDFYPTFGSTLRSVIPRYFESCDKVALSLTGGLDTRMLLACLPDSFSGGESYTYSGFNDGKLLDAKIAARVAKICGVHHQTIPLSRDYLSSYSSYLKDSVYASDGTCLANGAHELFFSKKASEIAPIRLTGNFGSEILRGVSTMKELQLDSLLFPTLQQRDEAISPPPAAINPVERAAFCEIPYKLIGTLLVARSQLVFRTPYLDNDIVELAFRAPIVARNASASLEFVRTINPQLANIETDRGVSLSRSVVFRIARRVCAEIAFKADYYDTEGFSGRYLPLNGILKTVVPRQFFGSHKFLPYWRWFREELFETVSDTLLSMSTKGLPLVCAKRIERVLMEHRLGLRNHTMDIVVLLTLAAIQLTLFQPTPSPAKPSPNS